MRRIPRVTSDRRLTEERGLRSGDAATATATEDDGAVRAGIAPGERDVDDALATDAEAPAFDDADDAAAEARRSRRRRAPAVADDDRGDDGGRARISFPLVPALVVLLVLLLGGVGYLWFTRPAKSAVEKADYVQALQAARSAVVDLTSFDYLTLDDDIRQIDRITTGDLRKETVDALDSKRESITQAKATVNTEVVAAAVTEAHADSATVLLVIQSTQESGGSDKPQVTKYRVEATLTKVGDRWLLSGIAGR
jgi:hypothetical protein